jgi:hypothetical protein
MSLSRGALCALLCLALSPRAVEAAEPASAASSGARDLLIVEEDRARRALNLDGMSVLMGWALLNMGVGGVGALTTRGRWRGFHEMNAGWGAVNMAIGAIGYWRNTGELKGAPSLARTLVEEASIREILLLNAGLDVGYMALGGLLWERGLRKQELRMVGWGQSVLMQGAFLMAFDLTLYALHRGRAQQWMLQLGQLEPGVWGVIWTH